MKTRKKQRDHPPQPAPAAPGPAERHGLTGGRRWRVLSRGLAAALALGLVVGVVWYAAAPPIPPVHLPEGSDAALVEAVSRARWAIRRAPWSDRPRGHMAMLLQAHSLDAEAAVFYAQAERLNPQEPRWPYLHSGVVASADGPQAIELLRRAAELTRHQAVASDLPLVRLGDLCLDNARLGEAEEAYTRLLQRRPDHPRAHLGLARLAVRRGEPDRALPHLWACANSPEVRKEAHLVLAEVHQRQGDAQAAAQAAQKAAQLPADAPTPDPWLEEVRVLLVGRTGLRRRMAELQGQGRLQEARKLEEHTTLEEYPDIGYLEVGRARLRKRQWAEAETVLRESLRLNPAELDGHYLLGRALFEQGRFAEAAECFRRATELDAKYGPAFREWGRCAAAVGDRAGAVRRLREALKYVPHDADAHRELGALLAAAGDREGAVHHLGQAVQLNPQDQRARQLLEQLSQRGGRSKP
jgi:tetratricopeptide (TPR) repeat protein